MQICEIIMRHIGVVFNFGQIYFDLRLSDYMSELTVLIQASDIKKSNILPTGQKMLGCVLASAILCIICDYLSARAAVGFTMGVREDLFRHVVDLGQEEMHRFSIPCPIPELQTIYRKFG